MPESKRILLLEPFFGGSHENWARGLQANSQHKIEIISLPDRHWKWRMHGAAITFARILKEKKLQFDGIICSDMLDVAVFKGLSAQQIAGKPILTYFHENQLTYPWSAQDRDLKNGRNRHYGFINYTSALCSDMVLFNSEFHRNSFLEALKIFLKPYPDHVHPETITEIAEKSQVRALGLDLSALDVDPKEELERPKRAVIGWNHRWEYDKGPEEFFQALFELDERGIDFRLIVLGERFEMSPPIFDEAHKRLKDKIIHFGYAENRTEYAKLLRLCDVLPVTAQQEFFGISLMEAMYCNVKPLLPKRLVYPEHIPEVYRSAFFYEDQADLVSRLQRICFNVKVLRNQETRQLASPYDWSEQIGAYDRVLEALCAGA